MTEMGLRIRRLLVETLRLEGLEPEAIADDQPLFGEGLGLDSIDALELVVALEREFGIAIANESVGRESLASMVTAHGERNLPLDQRVAMLYRLAHRLGFDPIDLFERRRAMTLMRPDELRQASGLGIDIQLHTHRHRLPVKDDASRHSDRSRKTDVPDGDEFISGVTWNGPRPRPA